MCRNIMFLKMFMLMPMILMCFFRFGSVQTASILGKSTEYLSECFNCTHVPNKVCINIAYNCPRCMMYRNDDDPNVIETRCCMSDCGPAYQVSMYNGRPTYFCQGDRCNVKMNPNVLGPINPPKKRLA